MTRTARHGAAAAAALLALWAGLARPARAAGGLGLAAAESEAVEGSPDYLAARAAASEGSWGRLEALSDFLPRFDLDASRNFLQAYPVIPVDLGGLSFEFPGVTPYAYYGFGATWTLFNGWRGVRTMRAAAEESRAAALRRDWALFRLEREVRLRFYQALAARDLAKLADVQVGTLRQHLRIVRDLLANGRATRFDLLRVEVELDDALAGRMDARDRVAVARRALAVAMGLGRDDRPLVGDLPEPGAAPRREPGIADKPDVRALLLEAAAARSRAAAWDAAWLPKVDVVGSYQWYYDGYNAFNQMDPAEASAHGADYNLGLALSWNLFDGGGDLARRMEAARRADAARETARKAELGAAADRDTWRLRLANSTALYRARLADVDKARESVRLATDGLEAGTRTTTEVLDAELDAYRAEAGVVSAKLEAAEALIHLELALGTGD